MAAIGETGSGENLRTRLAEASPRLRPSEQRVAEFLIREGHRFSDLTLSDLASRSNVSQSAVVQMCKKIGLSGFRDFRLRWVQESSKLAAQNRPHSSVFAKLFRELTQTESMIGPNLDRAADAIRHAAQVFILGGEASGLVAELAAQSLAVVGHMAVAFQDDQRLKASHAHFREGTVMIVISHRGVNPVLESAVIAGRDQGAVVIVITSRPRSPLAGLAHILLPTTIADPPGQRLVTSFVRAIQVAVVHAVIDAVSELGQTEDDFDTTGKEVPPFSLDSEGTVS